MITPRIKDVEVLEEYKLLIHYENGEKKIYDMKPNFKYKCFKKLENMDIFNTVKPAGETIEWITGEDISPEDLYYNSVLVK